MLKCIILRVTSQNISNSALSQYTLKITKKSGGWYLMYNVKVGVVKHNTKFNNILQN